MTKRTYFTLGFIAGITTLLISFPLRFLAGGLFIPELASQTFFSLVPGSVEAVAVGSLGVLAKYATFLGAILVTLIAYGILGIFLLDKTQILKLPNQFSRIVQLSSITYIVTLSASFILLQITDVLTQPISFVRLVLTLIPPQFGYGLSLYYLADKNILESSSLLEKIPDSLTTRLTRRNFVRTGVIGTVALITSIYGLNRLFRPSETPPITPNPGGTTEKDLIYVSEVTPNDLFFKVDINIISPSIPAESWTLKVTGLVNNPLEYSYAELYTLPTIERHTTLECISNTIGGSAMSTALLKGVPLNYLLEQAEVSSEAVFIIFRCHDGYEVGIPLERGQNPNALLAYEMNGESLTDGHGFPIRASIQGIYGMMHAKWIAEIELVRAEFKGFWQSRGWSNEAEYQTQSMILSPGKSDLRERFKGLSSGTTRVEVGSTVQITGIAIAGDRGISKVEVSVDGGIHWAPATLKDALSDDSWVLWSFDWIPPVSMKYQIIVKAIDKIGNPQIETRHGAFPDGSTGFHIIEVEARDP